MNLDEACTRAALVSVTPRRCRAAPPRRGPLVQRIPIPFVDPATGEPERSPAAVRALERAKQQREGPQP